MDSRNGPDYEKAFLYYKISSDFVVDKIPNLPDYSRFKSSISEKEAKYWKIYTDLTSSLLNDKQFQNIKNHLNSDGIEKNRDNSSSYLSTDPQKQVVFSKFESGYIEPRDLKVLIDKHKTDILLIDIRTRDEFNKNHIRSENVICIEPVSIRSRYTDYDVSNFSLITSPDSEKEIFSKRSEFELLVIYDTDSQTIKDSITLEKIFKIMSQKAFEKPLKRNPVILSGGLEAWVTKYGLSSFGHNHGELSQPMRLISRTPSQSRSLNSPIARNFNDYLSNPLKNDFHISSESLQKQTTPQFYSQRHQAPSVKRSASFKLLPLKSGSSSKVPTTSKAVSSSSSSPKANGASNILSPQDLNSRNSPSLRPLDSKSTTLNLQELHCTTGLCNIGNSCYMNCIIQCLLGTVPLLQIFLNGSYKQHVNINSKLGTKGIMAKFFAELAQSVFKKSESVYEPKNFKIAVGSINSMFRNDNQQDCSEFLNFVLDGLHEDLNESGNRPRLKELSEEEEIFREKMPIRLASTIEWERYLKTDFSTIVDFFQGQYMSQLKCLECGTTSTTYQAFSVLSLPIPETLSRDSLNKIPLDKCLEEFTKLEILDGDDRWHCSKCKKLRKSTKKITITRLPSNLIIHLKRFRAGMNYQKITNFINYPFDIDLTEYWPKVSSKDESQKLLNFPVRGQTPPFKYSLYGVANHSGTLGSGHYTAYVWKGSSKKWCYFDDTRVVRDVSKSHVVNSNAYVLFYTRVHN